MLILLCTFIEKQSGVFTAPYISSRTDQVQYNCHIMNHQYQSLKNYQKCLPVLHSVTTQSAELPINQISYTNLESIKHYTKLTNLFVNS